MICPDGLNIIIKTSNDQTYELNKMSDGEKVVMFSIAQVLQAPTESFIIVDEPELFLHKTIVNKLWDKLEHERKDCIFVYLTHDLDFASSRKTAKKLWIKSYTYPDLWEIEAIPENEIPENLLLEIVGSRKNVLFCEGDKGSNDEQILNYLFPDFTIVPVSSCTQVLNYTRAFNKISNINIKAIGIIDADFRVPEELVKLEKDKIFAMKVAEIENLFFSQNFQSLLEIKEENPGSLKRIKELVIIELEKEKYLQTSNFVSSKINTFFNNSHINKGNTITTVKVNFNDFVSKIEIEEWYNERLKQIEKIIEDKDYESAISIYNNKGLRKIGNQVFKITNFEERAFKLLQKEAEAKNALRSLFPKELIEIHKKCALTNY